MQRVTLPQLCSQRCRKEFTSRGDKLLCLHTGREGRGGGVSNLPVSMHLGGTREHCKPSPLPLLSPIRGLGPYPRNVSPWKVGG